MLADFISIEIFTSKFVVGYFFSVGPCNQTSYDWRDDFDINHADWIFVSGRRLETVTVNVAKCLQRGVVGGVEWEIILPVIHIVAFPPYVRDSSGNKCQAPTQPIESMFRSHSSRNIEITLTRSQKSGMYSTQLIHFVLTGNPQASFLDFAFGSGG